MGGEIAIDDQRLTVSLVGVGRSASVGIEVPEMVQCFSDIGPVTTGVMGGEVAINGQRLAVSLVGVGRSGMSRSMFK